MKGNAENILSSLKNRNSPISHVVARVHSKSPPKLPLCNDKSFNSVVVPAHFKKGEEKVRLNKSQLVLQKKQAPHQKEKRSIEPNQKIISRITQNLKLLEQKIQSIFSEQIQQQTEVLALHNEAKGKRVNVGRHKIGSTLSAYNQREIQKLGSHTVRQQTKKQRGFGWK